MPILRIEFFTGSDHFSVTRPYGFQPCIIPRGEHVFPQNLTGCCDESEKDIDMSVKVLYTSGVMKNKLTRIHGKFQAITQLTQQLDRSPKRFGTDELLTHTEIHLIEIIGNIEGLSVTDLARQMGVTKGAVSQSLKKLDKKGYTLKETDPENLSRSVVKLTSKGQTAFWAHKHWHETMDGGFSRYLNELKEGELTTIVEFLERVEDFLERRLDSVE